MDVITRHGCDDGYKYPVYDAHRNMHARYTRQRTGVSSVSESEEMVAHCVWPRGGTALWELRGDVPGCGTEEERGGGGGEGE